MLLGILGFTTINGLVAVGQRKLLYFPPKGTITVAESGIPLDRIRAVEVPSTDGLTLHGWYATPTDQGADAQQAPWLVILFSGNGSNRLGRTDVARMFNDFGCAVLMCDYRGYAENEGVPTERGLTDDSLAVWNYARHELNFPAENILICGESLGGGVATRLAYEVGQKEEVPAALILSMTFSSLPDVAAVHYPWLPARWLLMDRYPSIERITHLTCPILMLHGTQDPVVPYELGQKLYNAAPETATNGISKRFVTLPNEGHDLNAIVRPRGRQECRQLLKDLVTARSGSTPSATISD